jgi:hypothetical protein
MAIATTLIAPPMLKYAYRNSEAGIREQQFALD